MYKIAVMGDKDSVYAFASIGFSVFPVSDASEASALLKKLVMSGYAVIFITEQLAAGLSEDIAKYDDNSAVSITLIPGISGNTGLGMKNISKTVIRAVGADVV